VPTETDAPQSHARGKRHVPLKHVVPMRSCLSEVCKKEMVMRLFVVVLALEVAVSTQAMAFGSHGRMTKKKRRDAPQRFTVGQVATVCTTRITPNLTVPIRTGRRATIR
jgi:hypothetical protein